MLRLIACVAICISFAASAQLPGPPPGPPGAPGDTPTPGSKAPKKKIENKAGKKKDDAEKAAAKAASTDDIAPLPGDTVYFKNGSTLKGVTVVRESPAGVEILVTEGDSLTIPRKQIDHIEYKKADAPATADGAEPGASIILGQKVTPELFTKLTTALPDDSLEVKDTDFVKALEDYSKKLGVTIEISDTVKKIPAKERTWNVKLEKGAKLSSLLEEGLLAKFPNLQVDFPQDKIVISEKAPAAKPAQ